MKKFIAWTTSRAERGLVVGMLLGYLVATILGALL
jgi:hypothetical protein